MTSQLYLIFDLHVRSEISLPELAQVKGHQANIVINRQSRSPTNEKLSWLHDWKDADGTINLSLARYETSYLFRFPELADFIISSGGDQIDVVPIDETTENSVSQLLLDQVLPRVMAHRGVPVLHASAVALEHGMAVFLGASGAGKSTIAATLGAASGGPLADDCVALVRQAGQICGLPAYAGSRLWTNSPAAELATNASRLSVSDYSGKLRIAQAKPSAPRAIPIHSIFQVLADNDGSDHAMPTIRTLRGSEGLMALLEHSFKFDVTSAKENHLQFSKLGEFMHGGLEIHELKYPHNSTALQGLATLIERTIRNAGERQAPSP